MISRMTQFDVISHYRQGESYRQIARELGIDRKTGRRFVTGIRRGLKRWMALDGSGSEQEVEEATE